MALQRILIRTHHMTSRKKIGVITRATKRLDCSVVLKVGTSPGIMMCEGNEGHTGEWETVVRWAETNKRGQKLRYKDMRLLKREIIPELRLAALGVQEGNVREIEEIKDFGKLLEKDAALFRWWRIGMGYLKDDDGC
ncbi:hypothetical protein LSUE1_G008614 [Lachnellula suecica]|uniref:Uncharacterized protein n=1 Tax=Lachnellula suecica TaxID=602035 RepID=A0A8T9BWR7_9HELO|nr:hypothetical protein LSUE1_G008614 [Lachnellula suecica]